MGLKHHSAATHTYYLLLQTHNGYGIYLRSKATYKTLEKDKHTMLKANTANLLPLFSTPLQTLLPLPPSHQHSISHSLRTPVFSYFISLYSACISHVFSLSPSLTSWLAYFHVSPHSLSYFSLSHSSVFLTLF